MKLLKIAFIFTFIFAFINVNAQTEAIDTTDQQVYVFVEVQPEYIGGDSARLAYLANTIIYPMQDVESDVQGTVYVRFIVEKDGELTNAKILRGVSKNIDKESLRAVNEMPKWKPGFHEGKAVRCQFNMPIKFKIIADTSIYVILNDTSSATEFPPEFIGGDYARMMYLSTAVVYPELAKNKGIEGTVYSSFVVEKDGSISNVNVVSGIGGGCDESAFNAIKNMPKWKPGIHRGKIVRAQFEMPIKFILQQN